MLALPMLADLQVLYDKELSRRLAAILKHYGSRWPQEQRINISRIIFRMGNTYFEHINSIRDNPVQTEQSKLLILRAIGGLAQDCMSMPIEELA